MFLHADATTQEAAVADYSHFSEQACSSTVTHFGFLCNHCMVPDYRHVPSSPGMWKEPDAGPDGLVSSFIVLHWPPPQQQPVMSARSATRPGLKISWTSFKWLNYLKRTWFICLGHVHVWKHLSDKWCSSVPHVFRHKFEKHSTTILPRSDRDIPSLHFNPFHWWSNLSNPVVSHSLVCPSWLCCKIFFDLRCPGNLFNFVLSLYSLIKG